MYGKLKDNGFFEFYTSAQTLRDTVGGDKEYKSVTKGDNTLLGRMLWLRTDVINVDAKGREWGAYIESNVNNKTAKSEMLSDQASSTETIKGDEAQKLFELVHKIWNGYSVKYNNETLKPEVESPDDGGLKALVKDIESVKFLDIQLCAENKEYNYFLNSDKFKALENVSTEHSLPNDILDKYDEIVVRDGDAKVTETNPATATYGTFHSKDNDGSVIGTVKHLEYLPEINGKADTKDAPYSETEDPNEVFYYVLKNSCDSNREKDSEALDSKQTTEDGESKSGNDMLEDINEAKGKGTKMEATSESNDQSKSDEGKSDDKKEEEQPATGAADEVKTAYSAIVANNKASEPDVDYGELEKGIGSISTDGDDDEVKKNANESADAGYKSLDAAKKMLEKLGDIAKMVRDDVYLEEYFTEMFTCQTDRESNIGKDKAAKIELLNGYTVTKDKKLNTANPWYGQEIEYILWGKEDLKENLSTTETYIYLIRFALNAIYAFQASDITGFATGVASATVGWCPVLVPIVKVVVILGISLAESAYDLMLLKKGEGVVLLKNGNTFVCSPRGALAKAGGEIAKVAINKGAEFVENKIDSAIDNIGQKVNGKLVTEADACNDVLNGYANSLEEQVISSLKNNIFTPLLNSTEGILSRINETQDNAENLLTELIGDDKETNGKIWGIIDNNINQLEDDQLEDITIGNIVKKLYSEKKAELKSKVNANLRDIFKKDGVITTQTIQNAIWNPFENWIKNYKNTYITSKINAFTDGMKEKMTGYINESTDKAKTKIHELIDEKSEQFSKKAGEAIERNVAKYVSGTAERKTSGGINLTLNYKEFCKIFMFMKLTNNGSETACLQRAAALIQANVKFAAADANPNFNIVNAYTIVNVNATVEMGTLFPWTASVNTNDTGDADLQADFSDLGKKTVKINYSGINGY